MAQEDDLESALKDLLADPLKVDLQAAEGTGKMAKLAAYNLMERFETSVKAGEAPDPRLIRFIAERIGRVLDGQDARTWFPNKRPRIGKPKEDEYFRLAVEVETFKSQGHSEADAIEIVTTAHRGLSSDKVRFAHQEYRSAGKSFSAYPTMRPK